MPSASALSSRMERKSNVRTQQTGIPSYAPVARTCAAGREAVAVRGSICKRSRKRHMPRRKKDSPKDPPSVDLLKSQIEVFELKEKVRILTEIIEDQRESIKESTNLLIQQRLPRRPHLSSTAKQIYAARAGWKCQTPFPEDCPLYKLTDGRFTESLFECDHIERWSKSGQTKLNIRVLCPDCHSRITRRQVADMDSDSDME